MFETLQAMPADAILGLIAEHRDDLEFKREMVERGLSVEEIERLMQLHSKK